MSGSVEFEAANIVLPHKNITGLRSGNVADIAAITVGTGSSTTDLSTLFDELENGHFITIQADGSKVYIAFGPVAGTISSTATGVGATVCWPVPDGTSISGRLMVNREVPTGLGATMTYPVILHHQAVATCTLRLYRSSVDQNQELGKQFPAA